MATLRGRHYSIYELSSNAQNKYLGAPWQQ